jgi:hypothetical protein
MWNDNDDDEYKPVWPSGLWNDLSGGETYLCQSHAPFIEAFIDVDGLVPPLKRAPTVQVGQTGVLFLFFYRLPAINERTSDYISL